MAYEINRQIEKARALKASQAKKSEYGDRAFPDLLPYRPADQAAPDKSAGQQPLF